MDPLILDIIKNISEHMPMVGNSILSFCIVLLTGILNIWFCHTCTYFMGFAYVKEVHVWVLYFTPVKSGTCLFHDRRQSMLTSWDIDNEW